MSLSPLNGSMKENGQEPAPRLPWQSPAAGDRIDVEQVRDALRHHAWFILVVAGLLFALVSAATLASRMQFRSSGRLYLGEIGGAAAPGPRSEQLELSAGDQVDVGSEIEILTSRSLVARAAVESGLQVVLARAGSAPVRYWQWLLSRRDAQLLEQGAPELKVAQSSLPAAGGRSETYDVSFSTQDTYELSAAGRVLGQGRLGEPLSADGGELTLAARSGRPEPGAHYELTVTPLDEVIERALQVLDVSAARPAGNGEQPRVVTLHFSADSPLQSAEFLRRLMLAYLQQRQLWKAENATAAETFVTHQLEGARASLEEIQSRLADYRSSNRGVVLDSAGKTMTEQLGRYEEQRVAARLEVAALTSVQRSLKEADPAVGAYLFANTNDAVLEELATSLSRARQQLTDREARFNASAPDVREQQAQVDAQLGAIRNYVGNRLQRSQQHLDSLDAIVGQFEKRLNGVPGAELGLARLSRESEVYGRLYSQLLERQQQTAIIKASTISKNRVLDQPEIPHREASPKLLVALASIPFGILLGITLVLARGFAGGAFQGEGDVRRRIQGLSVFASLPRRRHGPGLRRSRGPLVAAGVEESFELREEREPAFVESVRALRLSVYHAVAGVEGAQIVLLTSPCRGDGKTTCTLALASLLAADGQRVLVIDGDLRQPTHQTRLGYACDQDLAAALAGEAAVEDALCRVEGAYDAIGASAPSSVELLSGDRFQTLLDQVREAYDFILVDAPSWPLVTDALTLVRHAHCVLSVLRPYHTSRALAAQHLECLQQRSPVFGVVLNAVNTRSDGGQRSSVAFATRGRPLHSGLAPRQPPQASAPSAEPTRATVTGPRIPRPAELQLFGKPGA